MAKRKMQKKALDLAEHNRRLSGQARGSGNAWLVAIAALSAGLALILLWR